MAGEKSERPLLESVTAVGFSGSQPEMALWAPFRNGVDMDRQVSMSQHESADTGEGISKGSKGWGLEVHLIASRNREGTQF